MQIGDYIRTKSGIIAKCIEEKVDRYIFDRVVVEDCYYNDYIWKDVSGKANPIKKYSPNITDLVEIGDILSFKDGSICRVLDIVNVATDIKYYLFKDMSGEQYYENEEWINDFSSIVTKEQFEDMMYLIGENYESER